MSKDVLKISKKNAHSLFDNIQKSDYFKSKKRKRRAQFNRLLASLLGNLCSHCIRNQKYSQSLHQRKLEQDKNLSRGVDLQIVQQCEYKQFCREIFQNIDKSLLQEVLVQPHYYIYKEFQKHKFVERFVDDHFTMQQLRKSISTPLIKASLHRKTVPHPKPLRLSFTKVSIRPVTKQVMQTIQENLKTSEKKRRVEKMQFLEQRMQRAQSLRNQMRQEQEQRVRGKYKKDLKKKVYLKQRKQIQILSKNCFDILMKKKIRIS